METTTTPFDLNQAIQQWRDGLAQSPAIRGENLDELEVHLRDSVATLQARDLSAEEAFLVATKRVGSGAVLGKEFGKVNAVNVWVERLLWALIVMQISTAIQMSFQVIDAFFRQATGFLTNSSSGWAAIASIGMITVIPMAATALIFWRLFKSSKSKVGHFLEKLLIQPLVAALFFFVLTAMAHLIYAYTQSYFNHSYDGVSWVTYAWFVPSSLVEAGLVFILARKRLLRKA